uniref:DNA mismatch repair proteins mutS family domain-containing protein n=1 Tax=Trichogramma kaykai TaxID=54128 RepID=A0ABD2XKE2_9HYME
MKIYGIEEIDDLTKKSERRIWCLATVSAIFYYIFHVKELIYNPKSISIEFRNEADYVQLDHQTLRVLGLSSFKYGSRTSNNFYKTINKCTTFFGKKFLYESLVQPFFNQNSIELRQNAVLELISNSEKRYFLQEVMRRLTNVHKLLTIESKFKYFGKNVKADNNLDLILNFDYFLKTFPEILKFAEGLSSEIFVNIYKVFSDECYESIKSLISSILRKDTFLSQNYISSLIQRCFAIKTQISELLDILRIAYCEITDKMIDYVNHLSCEYSLPLALGCNKKYGYHIQMKSNVQKKLDFSKISKIFTILKENDVSVIMTTKKLMVDNQTCKEICEEICIISNVLLEGLIEKLQNHKKPLMKLCSYIAELDFISCISEISSQNGFVRPIFGSQLYLIDSYHPLSIMSGSEMCECNDIVSSVSHNFQMITGPILSGKTTYLEQVITLQILAQIGCYVPAKIAMFRLSDRIFCHYSSNMQQLKKFESEIYELNHICDSLTPRSIVIIDEPLPNIFNIEGESTLMALCLRLSSSTAFTFCTTLHSCLLDLSKDILNITRMRLLHQQKTTNQFHIKYTV